jgi:hypothetical protein
MKVVLKEDFLKIPDSGGKLDYQSPFNSSLMY